MKPKLTILAALSTLLFTTMYGQNHFEAMNLQAHSNRKVTTIAEKNALRDEGALPAATEKNPCASLVVVKAAAMKAGAAVRTGEIQAANVVNQTVGFWKSTSTGIIPIDWNNFSKIQSYLDGKVIEINLDFGPGQKGKISGSVWNQGNTQLQGFGYDDAEIKGVHACFAWDLRSSYGDKALFPFMLRDCNNVLGANLILSYRNGSTTIASGTSDDQATAGNGSTPDQSDAEDVNNGGNDQADDAENIQKIIQSSPDGKNVFIIYNTSKSEGSRSSSNNTTNGGAATAPPQIVYLTPTQQQGQQQSSGGGQITWQSGTISRPIDLIDPALLRQSQQSQVTTTTTTGTGSSGIACTTCNSVWNREDVAYTESKLNNIDNRMAISNELDRKQLRHTKSIEAGVWLGNILHGAEFLGLDNVVQNALHTNATVNVRQIANLQNIASDGQPSDFPNGQNECPAGTTWNGYFCQ